ncbi:MAG: hypothetical protein ABI847_09970, partial [Anaerolineales bacterium]
MLAEGLTLSAAEMAVMMQHVLGPASGEEATLLADLDLTAAALVKARKALLARGLLRPEPNRAAGRTFIELDTRRLLGAAIRPNALGALTITRPGQPEHGVFFSWTPERLVGNTVDGAGLNRLVPLASLDEAGELLVRESGLADFSPTPGAAPVYPEAAARAATLRGVFMAVASMRTAVEQTASLAWFVSQGQLWAVSAQDEDAKLT